MSHPLETYLSLVRKDLANLRMENLDLPLVHPNLTIEEIQALKELTDHSKMTIKPVDKGGGIVVMNTDTYVQEAQRSLNDTNVYHKLDRDPKWEFERELKSLVDRAYEDGVIDDKLKDFLMVKNLITPVLYLLPKIHKTLMNPPGRPFVSQVEGSFLVQLQFSWSRSYTGLQ